MQDAPLLLSSHNMILAFMLLLAKSPPHGEKATSHTGLLWPVKVDRQVAEPSLHSCHSLTKESLLHVAAREASALNAIDVTGSECPCGPDWLTIHTGSGRI